MWKRLIAGESGIQAITLVFDLACQVAGVVPESTESGAYKSGLLNLNDFQDAKEQKKVGRFISLGIAAAKEALMMPLGSEDEESLERGCNDGRWYWRTCQY